MRVFTSVTITPSANMDFVRRLFFFSRRPGPERIPTDTVIPLTAHDDTFPNRNFAFEFHMQFDEVLEAERLADALWRLIDRPGWKRLGARLRLNVWVPPNNRMNLANMSRIRESSITTCQLTLQKSDHPSTFRKLAMRYPYLNTQSLQVYLERPVSLSCSMCRDHYATLCN